MLFNIMPTITNTKGIATINMGFITLSLIRLLIACGFWKREGIGTENTIAATPAPNPCHRCVCGSAFYLLRAIITKEQSRMIL